MKNNETEMTKEEDRLQINRVLRECYGHRYKYNER